MIPQLRASGTGSPWNRVQMAAQSVNQKASRSVQSGKKAADGERREDRVQLNPMKQVQSMIDHLMEQKQNLIEKKNQMIADTVGKGGDIRSIQSLIELYDEQINNIETQISQTMKEMMERQLEKKEEGKEEEPGTKEEQQIRQLSKLSNASLDYEKVSQVYSAYGQKKRDASILAQEISMDNSRGGVAPAKNERLGEMLKEADQLYSEAMKGYVDLNVTLREDEEENIQNLQQAESREHEEETAQKLPGEEEERENQEDA